MFNRKYIFKGSIFHCYVSLPECKCKDHVCRILQDIVLSLQIKTKRHDKETRKLQLQLSNHPMIRKLKSKKASSRKTCSKSPFPRCSCSSKNVTHWTSSSNVPDPNSGGRFWRLRMRTFCYSANDMPCSLYTARFGISKSPFTEKDLWHVWYINCWILLKILHAHMLQEQEYWPNHFLNENSHSWPNAYRSCTFG